MTNLDWAIAHLPNYALRPAQVRGRVRVYSIWQFGMMRSCARRGETLTMRQVDRRNMWTVQEWRERRRNA